MNYDNNDINYAFSCDQTFDKLVMATPSEYTFFNLQACTLVICEDTVTLPLALKGNIRQFEYLDEYNMACYIMTYASHKLIIHINGILKEEKPFDTEILSFQMNKSYLAVAIVGKLQIFQQNEGTELIFLKEINIFSTFDGLFALRGERLAYPIQVDCGKLTVFNFSTESFVTTVEAHKTALVAMVFDSSSEYLCTASKRGSIARIFEAKNGYILYEFRLGARQLQVCRLQFSLDSKILAVLTLSQTIKIFSLDQDKRLNLDTHKRQKLAHSYLTEEKGPIVKFKQPEGFNGSEIQFFIRANKMFLLVPRSTGNACIYHVDLQQKNGHIWRSFCLRDGQTIEGDNPKPKTGFLNTARQYSKTATALASTASTLIQNL